MRPFLPLSLLLLGAAPSPGEVNVVVRDAAGKPVANAVVIVRLVGRPTPAAHVGGGYQVRQQNIQFAPFVLVAPLNADVTFPNLDQVRHQVYSFSPAKKFELKLYAREQNRVVHFDHAGPVSLGCNIHDQMTAFVYVTDSAFTAKTDGSGMVNLNGVPAGPVTITVWHPYLRAPGNQVTRQINFGGAAREAFAVTLRLPPATSSAY
jgi:plastocyanin